MGYGGGLYGQCLYGGYPRVSTPTPIKSDLTPIDALKVPSRQLASARTLTVRRVPTPRITGYQEGC